MASTVTSIPLANSTIPPVFGILMLELCAPPEASSCAYTRVVTKPNAPTTSKAMAAKTIKRLIFMIYLLVIVNL